MVRKSKGRVSTVANPDIVRRNAGRRVVPLTAEEQIKLKTKHVQKKRKEQIHDQESDIQ